MRLSYAFVVTLFFLSLLRRRAFSGFLGFGAITVSHVQFFLRRARFLQCRVIIVIAGIIFLFACSCILMNHGRALRLMPQADDSHLQICIIRHLV
jgi:hypothetical protein